MPEPKPEEALGLRLSADGRPVGAAAGPSPALTPHDVELALRPSRSRVEFGEPWQLIGTLHNHSDRPVWISDAHAVLRLPDDFVALNPGVRFVRARFPTVPPSEPINLFCVGPGQSYELSWPVCRPTKPGADRPRTELVPAPESVSRGTIDTYVRRPLRRLVGQVYYAQSDQCFSIALHLWSERPDLGALGGSDAALRQSQLQQSSVIMATHVVPIDVHTARTLLPGASIGGIIGYMFLWWRGLEGTSASGSGKWETVLGLMGFAVLSAVVVMLLKRLSESRFSIAFSARDFWGALALGFLVAVAAGRLL